MVLLLFYKFILFYLFRIINLSILFVKDFPYTSFTLSTIFLLQLFCCILSINALAPCDTLCKNISLPKISAQNFRHYKISANISLNLVQFPSLCYTSSNFQLFTQNADIRTPKEVLSWH